MKIAILGGSFDPVHKGHLEMAKYAHRCLQMEEVWLMPSKATPLKDRTLTPFSQRSHMIKLAIRPYRYMKLCTLEEQLPEPSYTIDTIKVMKKKMPDHEFCLLIGNDQAKQLHLWKEIDELLKLAKLYVFLRDDESIACAYPVHKVQMPRIDISSTELRNGQKLYMLSRSVRDDIGRKYLYLDTMIRSHMNEKRYMHSVSVAKLCRELAQIHGVDEEKAYAAGLLHDVCKQWPYEFSQIWMRQLEPEHLQEAPAVWHGYLGYHMIKRYFHVFDEELLYAVRWHVLGSSKQKLAMILFVADKLDPSRGYDSDKELKVCKANLKQGYLLVKEQQQQYLKKEKQV